MLTRSPTATRDAFRIVPLRYSLNVPSRTGIRLTLHSDSDRPTTRNHTGIGPRQSFLISETCFEVSRI